jgi:zinc dependent phospholipase C
MNPMPVSPSRKTYPAWRLARTLLAIFLAANQLLPAYSVQTHEELIDLNWKRAIRPFLLQRFPHATAAELEVAHAYAFGGCAIQDLGYYPFSNQFFSNLTHYVRSAEFIRSLTKQAKNANELAFAIGALSHYVGDTVGHSQAVNASVAIEFPKLARKYGRLVTYDENPHAHVRTEFAFDVNEISKHRMAPSAYLRHIGLKVPSALLARAFSETYGLDFEEIVGERRPVVRSYRFAVRSFLPRIAYAESVLHKRGFPPESQSEAFQIFKRRLAETDFENGWNQYRKKPGIRTHLIAWGIFILPKIGPLSDLAIRGPSPQTQELYLSSVNAASDFLERLLATWNTTSKSLPDRDLDTGDRVQPGAYRLTDETYAKLLDTLTRSSSRSLPAGLKQAILDYYADPQAPISTKNDPPKWARVQKELAVLRAVNVSPNGEPVMSQ